MLDDILNYMIQAGVEEFVAIYTKEDDRLVIYFGNDQKPYENTVKNGWWFETYNDDGKLVCISLEHAKSSAFYDAI